LRRPPFNLPKTIQVPCGRFPARVQLWRRDGTFAREVAALPLAEELPNKFDATRPGPRAIGWRGDEAAELAWIEAQVGLTGCRGLTGGFDRPGGVLTSGGV
jgi:hypothetical protein